MTEPTPGERVWERGWRDHEQRQLERLAKLPLSEKLAWLEEAHRLVGHLGEGRRTGGTAESEEQKE